MSVSPATFAQQVAKARKANSVPFGGDRLAYRSQTGVERPAPKPLARPAHTLRGYSDECACEKWADCYYCGTCNPNGDLV